MRKLWGAAAMVAVVLTAGCIESTTTVQVARDGSGTVTETLYEVKSVHRMMSMLRGIGSALADESLQRADDDPFADRMRYVRRAAAMGQGVSLQSMKRVKRGDGSPGVRAVYAFEDIRTLRVPVRPNYPPPVPPPEPRTNDGYRVTFDYTSGPGEEARLTAAIPWADAARRQRAAYAVNVPRGSLSRDESALVAHVFSGFRIRLCVRTVPTFAETTASRVDDDSHPSDDRAVTVFDLMLGEAVRNDRALSRLAGIGAARDVSDALVKYAGLPGVTVEQQNSVTVRF